MKKLFNYKYGEVIFYSAVLLINLLFTIILYSLKLTTTGLSIWNSIGYRTISMGSVVMQKTTIVGYLCIALFILFLIGLFVSIGSIVVHFFKNKKFGYYIAIPYQIGLNLILIVMHIAVRMLSKGAIVLSVFNIIMMTALFIFAMHDRAKQKNNQSIEEETKKERLYKRILLVMESVSMGIVFLIFFIPLFSKMVDDKTTSYILIKALGTNTYETYTSVLFIILFVAFFAGFLYFASTISYYFRKDKSFAIVSKTSIYSNAGIALVFFLMGYFVCFYNGLKKIEAYTVSYIPFLLSVVVLIIYSIFLGKISPEIDIEKKGKQKTFKFEPLIYVALLTLITMVSLFLNVVEFRIQISSFLTRNIVLNGYQLLTTYNKLGGGFQLLAFLLFAFLLTSGVLFILSLSSFFAKYRDYYKVVKLTVVSNVIFMLLLGLFGMYFKIAQKMNEEAFTSFLEIYQIAIPSGDYNYTVSSQCIYLFAASLVVFIIMIFRGQLNHHIAEENILKLSKDSALPSKGASSTAHGPLPVQIDFDACPAFTELDSKLELYKTESEKRNQNAFENITLPNLVRFIVDYARESRLHLSYSLEDIATFVAGLGASRLAILQGMSGTGKTSLPKIFAEAIMGNCEIVEVESSWRDKNELLGYYNEFSKCFTPKKFTQCLYKAKLNPSVPTFIVLDEMNLSRIEYYFSDFLSLMENEEEKREIKLLNVKLARIVQEEPHEYYGLTDGHTIKIPSNVWFIGTANRDESTFEISDKVYDRAQTMNFNKRAPKIHSFSEPLPQKFASYEQIAQLFIAAKNSIPFDAEENKIINRVENLLAPYNISFGNRILKQMEDFVKIYCACFGDKAAVLDDAVEKILLSKVVSKLEYKIVENKEELALEFDKLGLSLCSQFVRKLNED